MDQREATWGFDLFVGFEDGGSEPRAKTAVDSRSWEWPWVYIQQENSSPTTRNWIVPTKLKEQDADSPRTSRGVQPWGHLDLSLGTHSSEDTVTGFDHCPQCRAAHRGATSGILNRVVWCDRFCSWGRRLEKGRQWKEGGQCCSGGLRGWGLRPWQRVAVGVRFQMTDWRWSGWVR